MEKPPGSFAEQSRRGGGVAGRERGRGLRPSSPLGQAGASWPLSGWICCAEGGRRRSSLVAETKAASAALEAGEPGRAGPLPPPPPMASARRAGPLSSLLVLAAIGAQVSVSAPVDLNHDRRMLGGERDKAGFARPVKHPWPASGFASRVNRRPFLACPEIRPVSKLV